MKCRFCDTVYHYEEVWDVVRKSCKCGRINGMKGGFPRILVVGHKQHGKDTVGEWMADSLGIFQKSSSDFAFDKAIWPSIKNKYRDWKEVMEDKENQREEWMRLICEYNKNDKARLAKELLQEADIYIGMRAKDEFDECKRLGLFDLIAYVDASPRKKKDDPTMQIKPEDCDVIIMNNGSKKETKKKVENLCKVIAFGRSIRDDLAL